ncbi:hypothetical protein TARUN_4170 [Trichoderma arundinaceum]|uniref:Uncharacterized protein n=1 Tax=Trichoderma arundinaceum TaxID=490622 RepID=A0A395NQE9_TRIAR|nr:hypothetical protein TARUN_4170 [Trichoderma arundinaceum]
MVGLTLGQQLYGYGCECWASVSINANTLHHLLFATMEVVAVEESSQDVQLPEFDVSFRDSLPTFYFHHIIDPVAATLRVEVLGPNLAYTFRHERAKELRLSASTILSRLERKTTGFLTLRTDHGKKRIVLAWAESGNGAGRGGDLLDAEPSVLPNDIWTQRVISMGKVLALRMGRPFDGRLSRDTGRDMTGIFLGGHVEAKLAVHAIFVLLSKFGISQDLDKVSLRHLKVLRQARWDDGSRPSFEIYFSRKNCAFCGKFVRRLQRATGIPLRLIWRDRLVKMVYEQRPLAKAGLANRPRPQGAVEIDVNDAESLCTNVTDEVHVIDLVDLSRDNHAVPAEVINLTGDPTNSGSTPSEQDPHGQTAADTYIDGLAYCVGQIEQCPAGAQAAILELAERVREQRNAMSRRAAALANISKPLPATPQMAPPGWMAVSAGAANIEEALGAESALANPLPTPPSSGSRRDGQANGDGRRALLNRNGTSNFHSEAPQITEITPSRASRHRPSQLALRRERDARLAAPASAGQPRATSKRVSICIELPSRQCSSSPDPF